MIVDDNRDGADSLATMLRFLGNDTSVAYDGEEGIKLAEAYQPNVILFDIGMPKMNGYEACRYIREQPWGKSPVLIAGYRLGTTRRSRSFTQRRLRSSPRQTRRLTSADADIGCLCFLIFCLAIFCQMIGQKMK